MSATAAGAGRGLVGSATTVQRGTKQRRPPLHKTRNKETAGGRRGRRGMRPHPQPPAEGGHRVGGSAGGARPLRAGAVEKSATPVRGRAWARPPTPSHPPQQPQRAPSTQIGEAGGGEDGGGGSKKNNKRKRKKASRHPRRLTHPLTSPAHSVRDARTDTPWAPTARPPAAASGAETRARGAPICPICHRWGECEGG